MVSRDPLWQCLYPRRVSVLIAVLSVPPSTDVCAPPQVAASVCYGTVAYYLLKGRVRAPLPEEGCDVAAATVATVSLEEPLLMSIPGTGMAGTGMAMLCPSPVSFFVSFISHAQRPPPCPAPSMR